MKKIVIEMEKGKIEARYDDGEVLRQGKETAFLGRFEIDENSMSKGGIGSFLDLVVVPRLEKFADEIRRETDETKQGG